MALLRLRGHNETQGQTTRPSSVLSRAGNLDVCMEPLLAALESPGGPERLTQSLSIKGNQRPCGNCVWEVQRVHFDVRNMRN